MTKQQILEYEVLSTWWASWVPFGWGATYIARKTERKWRRYKKWKQKVDEAR